MGPLRPLLPLLMAAAAVASALPFPFPSDKDRVTALPHLDGPLCFRSFAGYLPVAHGTKFLFYWYHEAIESPQRAPWVLWLNGGPGCSSLGGMFFEHGPFVVDAHLNVTLNPYSWNRGANVLYLEQPAGVGFSYPEGPANDTVAADDSYEALQVFLKRRSELTGRPFYIAGESYAGHYVPNLVHRIQEGGDPRLNLQGFMVGNAYTDWRLDFSSNVPFARFHGLASPDQYAAALAACDGDTARGFWPRPDVPCPAPCLLAVMAATSNAMDGSLDSYDIYEDTCRLPGQRRAMTQAGILRRERAAQLQGAAAGTLQGTTISPVFDTCADVYAAEYLNLPEVQRAIHVRPGTVPRSKWADCGGVPYAFNYESVVPLYAQWAAERKLRILVYSGDTDFIVNFLGTQNWLDALNLTVLSPWQSWRGSDKQVAGYFTVYDGLTFLTVKGAGHMVPKDRPLHALDLFTSFLTGRKYDYVPPAKGVGPLCPK